MTVHGGRGSHVKVAWGVVERCRLGSVGVAVEESWFEDGAIFRVIISGVCFG